MARSKAPVAIVTGAAHGIGRAIAQRLLNDGWRVGVLDLPGSGLKRRYGGHLRRAVLIEGDVAEEETARRAVKLVTNRFGRLDALVSNAGIMVRKPLRRLTLAEWHKVLDTNLTAALFARAAEVSLRATRGAMVTIASTRALMSEPNTESYSASKGGLLALTHALAISLGPDVRVNCISPGCSTTR
jgi:NAD(P)-dependent dehydrogenase (short-subunit alcohol dehydrogenase family)